MASVARFVMILLIVLLDLSVGMATASLNVPQKDVQKATSVLVDIVSPSLDVVMKMIVLVVMIASMGSVSPAVMAPPVH